MKKASIVLTILFVVSLMAGSAFAQRFCQDFLETGNPGGRTTGLKTCDTTISVNAGETFVVDIWAVDVPESLISSGFDMTYDPAQVSIVSVLAYDNLDIAGGPWDGGGTFKIPDVYGPGSYEVGVIQFGCAPVDAGNDVIIAKVTFQCLAGGSSPISVKAITGFDTTVGCVTGVNLDPIMGTNNLTVTQVGAGCTTNEECSDGVYCNGAETCNIGTGECQPGTSVVCNDGIGCTTDSCNETTDSCDYIPNNAACNDGLYCNGNEICSPASGCVPGTPVSCPDDQLFCNGTEACNEATDSCQSSGDPCTPPEVCNEDTNTCAVVGCTTDEECSDGSFCSGVETCNTNTGQCQAGTPVDCADGVACTTDSCNEGLDRCDNTSSDAACSDGLFCNGNEVCDAQNGCLDGTPVDCADDGLFCNGIESCNEAAESCVSSGNPCIGAICNEETNSCDQPPGCEVDEECDNGLFCDGAERCVDGTCQAGTAVNCDDEVACTTDSCNESTDSCDHAPNNAVCSDGNFCNGNEICDAVNGCLPGEAVSCPNDGIFCNGTESCNEAADSCQSSGDPCPQGTVCNEGTDACDEIPVEGCKSDAECDDGIFCNGKEKCSFVYSNSCETPPPVPGVCIAGTPVDCNDGVDCTIDSCNEAKDKCDHAPDNAVCDDGDFCNGNEICDPAKGCKDGEAVVCPDNGLFCDGTESCNEAKDSCASSGNPCTPDVTVCNEKTDTCDPVAGCKSDAECDDGIFCNGIETCNAYVKATGTNPPVTGVCQDGIPVDCNDGLDCTIDSCNEAMDKCDHVPDNAVCDDGNFCNGNEVCDPDSIVTIATQESSGSTSGCKSGEAVTCPDDGKFCDGIESCNEAADSCQSSGNPCIPGISVCNEKTDSCDPLSEGCKSDADCDDGIFCNGKETCNVYAKATGTNPPVTGVCKAGIPVDCHDGADCTVDSCNEDTDSCVNTADDAYCPDDGKFCNGTEFCDAEHGCKSTGNPCAEGTVCNEQKDTCDTKECLTVQVDIKPVSLPNVLSLKGSRVLVVAILGSKDFNVKDIDPSTIMIGREGVAGGVAPRRYAIRNVATTVKSQRYGWNNYKRDQYKDIILRFDKAELIDALLLEDMAGETIPLAITGNLKANQGGTEFAGEDSVNILKK